MSRKPRSLFQVAPVRQISRKPARQQPDKRKRSSSVRFPSAVSCACLPLLITPALLEQSQPKTLRQLARIRQAQLDSASARPLASKGASDHQEAVYPHVYSAHTGGSTLSQFGQKFSLPAGTTKASYEVRALSLHRCTETPCSGLVTCFFFRNTKRSPSLPPTRSPCAAVND